jgi:2-dehydro-3-deoxygluconokinase
MPPTTDLGSSAAAGPEVIAVGEPLIALLAAGSAPLADVDSFSRHVAGAEANLAVGLARLGHRVLYVGRVGADGFGRAIVRRLRGEEVDVSGVVVDAARRTGLMVRERRVLGPSEVVYHRSGSAGSALEPSDVDAVASAFGGAQWLHLTGITPALSESAHRAVLHAIELARAAGVRISFDVNLRRRLWSDEEAAVRLHPIATGADLVFGDADELAVVAGVAPFEDGLEAARALRAEGARAVVVKRGAAGATLVGEGEPVAAEAIQVARVVDPVGAGDAFCAGYLAALLDGLDPVTALRWGNGCAAAVLTVEGDLTGLPSRAELEQLIGGTAADTIR